MSHAQDARVPGLSGRVFRLCVACLVFFFAMPILGQAPAGYYDAVDAGDASVLRSTLHDAIDDHTRFPYTASTTDTWDILNLADEDPNDTGRIVDLYMNASYAKIAGGVGAYNREHSWPKSYGFPNDGTSNYPYTDCHHLFAADAGYNSSRSNKPFRNCDGSCGEQTTLFTDGRGGGSGVYPGNSNWTSGSFAQGTWETWGGRKGDVARAILYMDIRYEGGNHSITGIAEPDLIVTDNEALIDASNTGSNESVGYMGMLSVLLQWHAADPVDSREIWRNEVVYTFQGNRNPFIDHPEWVSCLFENICTTDTTPPAAPTGLFAMAANGGANLSWNANSENDLGGYHVYRATSSGGPYTKVNGTLVTGNAFSDGGLVNGTTYYYVVTAVDTASNESGDSNQASVVPDGSLPDGTPPAAPSGLAANPGDGQVALSWAANGETDLAGYNLYRGTSSGGPYSQVNGSLLTGTTFNDSPLSNGTTYYYVLTAVDTSSNESAQSTATSAIPSAPGGSGSVVLSEVFYDPVSSDDGLEWVELYNNGSTAVNLAGYSLGNGGTDYTYSLVQLSGTLQPGQTFVVGGPTSNSSNGNPTFDQVINFNPDFQNSGSTADGVALFDVPAAQVNGSTVPVDAVVYGGSNGNGLIDETGVANGPEVGDASSGSSIERLDLAGNWQVQSNPDPNHVAFGSVNTAPSVVISGPADGSGFLVGQSIGFVGSANDAEEGNLSAFLSWSSNLDGPLGSGGSFNTTLSQGTHVVTASVTDSGGLGGSAQITVTVTAAPVGNTLLLSEVFYDPTSTDDGLEWVELFNNGTTAVNLSGYSLGNGGPAYTTSLVQLSGVIQPGATFVVGGPTSNGSNGNPIFDQAIDFSPDFQNSGSTADGVALFALPAAQVNGLSVPVDAVVYGGSNLNGLIDETGVANAPEVGDAPSGSSIERLDVQGNWQIQSVLSPGQTPLAPSNNTAPSVTITSPSTGSAFNEGVVINLGATATDNEDGSLTGSLSWASDLDGFLGTGGALGTTLSLGNHTLTASVIDSGGLSASDIVTVTVQAAPSEVTIVLTSLASEDGWLRESSETSNVGGRNNSSNTGTAALRAGDDRNDRQYKGLVSFDTSVIPNGATILSANLRLRRGTVSGTNPFNTHGTCWVDMRAGAFGGSNTLADSDFEAAADVVQATSLSNAASNGNWSEGALSGGGLAAVNVSGTTQFRVYFSSDDNDDRGNDYVGFYSADNGTAGNHPQLVITYQP